jgi:hypothetical protein
MFLTFLRLQGVILPSSEASGKIYESISSQISTYSRPVDVPSLEVVYHSGLLVSIYNWNILPTLPEISRRGAKKFLISINTSFRFFRCDPACQRRRSERRAAPGRRLGDEALPHQTSVAVWNENGDDALNWELQRCTYLKAAGVSTSNVPLDQHSKRLPTPPGTPAPLQQEDNAFEQVLPLRGKCGCWARLGYQSNEKVLCQT